MFIKRLFLYLVTPFLLLFCFLYVLRPPGSPPDLPETDLQTPAEPYLSAGKLPGVTWVDDVHPIFVRNRCGDCHTRGKEEIIDGLEEFSLGIIDPDDIDNPYYGYHELVYTEGAEHKLEGEALRDGQCCWPRDYPADRQRRIWLGHPERSVLLRKLERDYYDWNRPPRFLAEGLRLLWGMPMPLLHDDGSHREGADAHGNGANAGEREEHRGQGIFYNESFWRKLAFRAGLWVGIGRERLSSLPPRIPTRDRALLRYWIENTIQLRKKGTGIVVHIRNEDQGEAGGKIVLVGNFNTAGQHGVHDASILQTDENGRAELLFPEGSVVSLYWYAGFPDMPEQEYKKVVVVPGEVNYVEFP